jgi:hypothetical protein
LRFVARGATFRETRPKSRAIGQSGGMNPPKILLAGDARLAAFPAAEGSEANAPGVVGWREWVGLPELGIARVEAKIDTGARTSALHAGSIEAFEADGETWVRFDVTGEGENVPWHEAPVADRRSVRSSNGETELRYVIRTELALAGRVWPVEISLTNRERMELPMLIGREALAGRVLVDAEKSWLWGRPRWRPASSRRFRPATRRRARSGEVS